MQICGTDDGNCVAKPIFFGLDGCKAGWFYIGIDEAGECQFGVLKNFKDLHP